MTALILPGSTVELIANPHLDWRRVVAVGDDWVTLALPSGESRQFPKANYSVVVPAPVLTIEQLQQLADDLKVRDDWHEPDEVGVTARMYGEVLDNAYEGTPIRPSDFGELNVVLLQHGHEVAVLNVATLIAWAARA